MALPEGSSVSVQVASLKNIRSKCEDLVMGKGLEGQEKRLELEG